MSSAYQSATHSENNKDTRQLSLTKVIVIVIAVAIVAFGVGVYHRQVLAAVGTVVGIPIHAGEIDTRALQTVYQQLKANYDGELNDQVLIEGASRGLVEAAGDDYTEYLSLEESAEFNSNLSGSIGGGIGAEIGLRGDRPTVVRVLSDTPAERAGLQNGDTILRINDESTKGWTVSQAVEKIRGEIDTTVRLDLRRGSESLQVTITREEITTPSVEYEVKDGVGVITMTRFDDQTSRLAREAAQSFERQDIDRVILDLRGNGGGYLNAAREVSGLWLNNDVVVTERRGDEVIKELRSGRNPILADATTVVLVDQYSASASEIVAGALQDHDKATLVGVKTFGKGTVQQLISLPYGAELKVTIARWFTPNGKNITESGIIPEHVVELSEDDLSQGNDRQLEEALRLVKQ